MSKRPAEIYVTNLFGHNTRKALVSLRVRDVAVQMSPQEARGLAIWLFECAEAATQDAFVFDFVGRVMDGDERAQAAVLQDFREFRTAYEGSALGEQDE